MGDAERRLVSRKTPVPALDDWRGDRVPDRNTGAYRRLYLYAGRFGAAGFAAHAAVRNEVRVPLSEVQTRTCICLRLRNGNLTLHDHQKPTDTERLWTLAVFAARKAIARMGRMSFCRTVGQRYMCRRLAKLAVQIRSACPRA